jgi:outer membrane protein
VSLIYYSKLMVSRFKRNLLVGALLLITSTTNSQDVLTLEQAIATALRNNYDIQLARNDSAVAALDYSFRNAVFLPRLNGTVGTTYNRNNQKQEFVNGTKREGPVKTNNLTGQLALNWTLFDGLKMFATREKAEELVRLGELGIKNQVVNTVASVINTYYNIARQKQQLKAIEEQMGISQVRVNLAEQRLNIGVGTKPDVLQSKVDLNAQKAAQLEQQTLIDQLKEQLNQLMNVTTEITSYTVIDTIPINSGITLGEIQSGMESRNPLLLYAKKNIDIAGLTVRERKAERFPIISFTSNYNFNRTNNDVTLNPALPLFNRNKGINYGLGATIPILNNFSTRRLIRQAQLDLGYQELVYASQRAQLNMSVLNAYREYEQQKKALMLEEENILLAKENVSIALEVYRLGASTLLQLREAQISLESAYDRLIAARYETKVAETELLRLKGELVQ